MCPFQIDSVTLFSEYSQPEFKINNDIVIDISVMKETMLYLFQIAFITLFSEYSQPEYGDGYTYQPYAIVIGICIGLLPIAAMVVVGLWQVTKAKGSLLEVRYMLWLFNKSLS